MENHDLRPPLNPSILKAWRQRRPHEVNEMKYAFFSAALILSFARAN